LRETDACQEGLIDQVKDIVDLLYEVVSSRRHEWQTYLDSARSIMNALDQLRFFRDPSRLGEQIWILQGLQNFACHDADNGYIQDIAEYCQVSWLQILRNFAENVEVLIGEFEYLIQLKPLTRAFLRTRGPIYLTPCAIVEMN
jgi:hypothetical protein